MLRFMVSHILVVDPTVHLSKRPTMEDIKPSPIVAAGCGGGEKHRLYQAIVKP